METCELIELKDLSVSDPIELTASAATKTIQLSLSRPAHLIGNSVRPRDPTSRAADEALGHDLQPHSRTHLTWCDLCGEFIWGLNKPSLRCTNCRYTCHYRCQPFIQLCCSSAERVVQLKDDADGVIESDTNVDEQNDLATEEPSPAEIQQKVKEYNAQINTNLHMVAGTDGTYTGFIKVHFQLVRPVSLPSPTEEEDDVEDHVPTRRRTSFYLPRDTAKHLHISSHTRVHEVIQALLNKFTVVDNPAKFALFERRERQNQVYLRKLSDEECPLHLRLSAGPSEKVLSLVLKENETGDVNWYAFSFPELCNFLRILRREEEEHVQQIVRRYTLAKERMKQAMATVPMPV